MQFPDHFIAAAGPARRDRPEKARSSGNHASIHSGPHEFGPVHLSDFSWLDAEFYEETGRELRAVGFECLGDVENLTLSAAAPEYRTAVREFASGDGVIAASVWQVKARGWRAVLALHGLEDRGKRIVELVTSLDDGTFIVTTNGDGLAEPGDVAGIERTRMHDRTPVARMIASHRERIEAHTKARRIAGANLVRSRRDMRRLTERLHALRCAAFARDESVAAWRSAHSVIPDAAVRLRPAFN